MAENDTTPTPFRRRKHAAGVRSVVVGTTAAFAGGALVIALQALLALASARYPPIVQGLRCNFLQPATGQSEGELGDEPVVPAGASVRLLPAVSAGDEMSCELDAPGADYAAWAMMGRDLQFRSGPIEPGLECQDGASFAAQSPDHLRLSICQRFHLGEPGTYTLVAKVMAKGSDLVDRGQIMFVVHPPPAPPPPPPEPPAATRITATLLLPAREVALDRSVPVSESLSEHKLLPTSRDYSWIVYRLRPDETYVGSGFQSKSASNASATQVSYVPAQRAVAMSFTLRSGPYVDQWRGWLSGNVVVNLRRTQPAQPLDLPDIDLRLPGRATVALPPGTRPEQLAGARLRLVRGETGSSAEAPLGQAMVLDQASLVPHIEDGLLVIDATRR